MIVLATFLGKLPRPVWIVLAGIATALLLWRWHQGKLGAAFAAGATAQAATDTARFDAAAHAAAAAQAALVTRLASRQAMISKGTEDALLARNDDLARRHHDLRLRWTAYNADQGGASKGGATALSGAAGGFDAANCATQGWVSFDTAAAAAEAADRAIAKDDAWLAWVAAQRAAWPGE